MMRGWRALLFRVKMDRFLRRVCYALAVTIRSILLCASARDRVSDMITCQRCNTENLTSSQYCDECGALLLSIAVQAKGSNGKPVDAVVVKMPHARLVMERGRGAGKEFLLHEDEIQIGRWDADGGIFPDVDLDADDPEAKVSRRHARIVRRSDQYTIEDLGSTNGTFINRGRRLVPGDRHALRDGDEIIVGKTFLRFHMIK